MDKRAAMIPALMLAASIALASCSGQPMSTREEGTLGGAGIGADLTIHIGDVGSVAHQPAHRDSVTSPVSGWNLVD